MTPMTDKTEDTNMLDVAVFSYTKFKKKRNVVYYGNLFVLNVILASLTSIFNPVTT